MSQDIDGRWDRKGDINPNCPYYLNFPKKDEILHFPQPCLSIYVRCPFFDVCRWKIDFFWKVVFPFLWGSKSSCLCPFCSFPRLISALLALGMNSMLATENENSWGRGREWKRGVTTRFGVSLHVHPVRLSCVYVCSRPLASNCSHF